jgi:predicted TIM-barrel fold metal-dependent hydrolase
MTPIEYYRRQIYFTYINEPHAVENRDVIGVDRLLFATDYPHSASTWPKSQDVVERDTADLPPQDRRRLIHDNVLEVYNLGVLATA